MESSDLAWRVAVRSDTISADKILSEIGDPHAGAVVLFLGTARNHSPGRAGITHLNYEAYPEAVESVLSTLIGLAADRWPILKVVVEHRVGKVEVGQTSVAVGVAAPHRADAWAAGQFLIDELKSQAPIWKQENWEEGSEWIEGA